MRALPKVQSISKEIINPAPDNYEAYLYSFTNKINGMMYVGYHTGAVDGTYDHSSKNKDFIKIYTDSDPVFIYKVLEYGTTELIKLKEHRILEENNAKDNSLFYNNHNGSPQHKALRLAKVIKLKDEIIDGKYNDGKRPIEDLVVLEKFQARCEDDGSHQRAIRERIDDAGGNTDECDPIVIYAGRGEDGADLIGDGNHTLWAANSSKKAHELTVAMIPKERHKNLTHLELETVSLYLNPEPKKIKKPSDNNDWVRLLVRQREESGTPVNSESNRETLTEANITKYRQKTIIKKANQVVSENKAKASGQKFCSYAAEPYRQMMKKRVEQNRTRDQICFSLQSKSDKNFDWIKINKEVFANMTFDKNDGWMPIKPNIKIIIHHTKYEYEDSWKTEWQPHQINKCKAFLKPLGFNVTFEEMQTTVPNEIK